MKGESQEDYMTLLRAAQVLRVHPNTIYRWIKDLGLPASKVGRVWRIRRPELEEWFASRKKQGD